MTTSIPARLEARLRDAVAAAVGEEHRSTDPLLRPAAQPQFGDYQANLAMSLAKRVGAKPRALAEAIVAKLDPTDLVARAEVAGPGFINLTLEATALGRYASALLADPRAGIEPVPAPQRIVIDYSAPNVAKEMHVGHLRSTIIGDAIARVLIALGHRVTRQNHLGDWGTQFGMLLEYLEERPDIAEDTKLEIGDLNAFYQAAKQCFDQDSEFAKRARERVVLLQSHDPVTLDRWQQLVDASMAHFEAVYERLGVLLDAADIRGESAYNELLPEVIRELESAGCLRQSEGALVVYPEGFAGKDGEPLPMIVRKSDGGYLYATTDLAAARYRIGTLRADRMIYVTDARQSQHFAMVFQTLRQVGWAGPEHRFDHVPFGSVLGADRRPYKTREGGTVRLVDVLDEAEERASRVIAEKNPSLDAEERARVARVVGIGALKYADLSSDRIKDYVFDWDRMLALEGNTAPYLINAYVRIQSIFRRSEVDPARLTGARVQVVEDAERALVLHLAEFPTVVAGVADSLEPHRLCTFLYELASRYHRFYERCPVLKAPSEDLRDSRLALSAVVARTLRSGLELLGIGTVDRM